MDLGIEHFQVPLRAKPRLGAENYVERLKLREISLLQGLQELEGNLKTIDNCEESLIKRVEMIIQDNSSYKDRTIGELQASREEIQALAATARKEIATHLYKDSFQPQTQLMKSLWSFEPGNFELFQYSETEQYQVKSSEMSRNCVFWTLISFPSSSKANWCYPLLSS